MLPRGPCGTRPSCFLQGGDNMLAPVFFAVIELANCGHSICGCMVFCCWLVHFLIWLFYSLALLYTTQNLITEAVFTNIVNQPTNDLLCYSSKDGTEVKARWEKNFPSFAVRKLGRKPPCGCVMIFKYLCKSEAPNVACMNSICLPTAPLIPTRLFVLYDYFFFHA